uniref:Late embryogenesis abundant protein n=1 Tax=Tamarix hispida TaxID=189793 RepID=W0FI46_9CARY|nr:late embryogenesis abundant protein [Tamarix hispida]
MMNVIALCLVFSSLAFASIWSPTPPAPKQDQDMIHKGGHRAVLVEYADTTGGREGGETKVLISRSTPNTKHTIETVEDEVSSVAASVAGIAEKATGGPKGLICDVYGKCKHTIADVLRNGEDKVAEEGTEEAVYKTKDAAHVAKEAVGGVAQEAKDAASKVKETMEESAAKMGEKARRAAQATVDKSKRTGEHVSDKIGDMKDEAKEEAKRLGKKGKKELSDIARRGKEVIYDIFGYIFSIETVDSLTNVVQLMGLATAYGVSIWVTFVMSHVLASVLPRQQFGVVQSKIYPVYFKVMASGIGAALAGHLLGQRKKLFDDSNRAGLVQGYNLLSSLLFVLANLLILEPRATKVMFERMKLEKEEGRGRESSSFTGHRQGKNQPRRVVDTFVTSSSDPGPVTTDAAAGTAATITSPTAAPNTETAEQVAVRSKMQ